MCRGHHGNGRTVDKLQKQITHPPRASVEMLQATVVLYRPSLILEASATDQNLSTVYMSAPRLPNSRRLSKGPGKIFRGVTHTPEQLFQMCWAGCSLEEAVMRNACATSSLWMGGNSLLFISIAAVGRYPLLSWPLCT